MTINGNRKFNFNGKSYYVQTNPKSNRESENDNYYLTLVTDSGMSLVLYNCCGWDVPKFKTIKEAQKYVVDWEFVLVTM